jgi:trigger factor
MKAEVTALEGHKVKLSVQVEEAEVDRAVDETMERLAKEMFVPGFRRGKVPRRVIEARVGRAAVRRQALDSHIPNWYERAVVEKDVDVINQAEIQVTGGEEQGAVSFDAVVEVRPKLQLEGYERLKVTIPSPVVKEEEVQAQVDRLRANFAELAVVDREARKGDTVTIDMSAVRDGEPVPSLTYTDYSVEVGAGNDLPELDEHLPGAKAGDSVGFEADPAGTGKPAQVTVLVKQVEEKVLPDETDEWASEASEFSTVAELREDIRKRLADIRRAEAALSLRTGTMDALVSLVNEEPPQVLVDAETRRLAENLGSRLDSQGVTLDRYLERVGRNLDDVVAGLRERAVASVKADLALRAVAEALRIEPSEAELEDYMAVLAREAGVSPAAFAREVERAGRRAAVRSELKKSKAFGWLMDHADVRDEEGNPVDRSLLAPPHVGQAARVAPAPPSQAATGPAEPPQGPASPAPAPNLAPAREAK